MARYIAIGGILTILALSNAVLAAGENMPNESGLVLSAVQKNPNAILHRPEHKDREAKVVGIVNGMVNKLTNLSQRLENQLIQAKQRATSSSNITKLEMATQNAQGLIAATILSLQTIPESDKPASLIPEIREQVGMLRTKIETVRMELISFNQNL